MLGVEQTMLAGVPGWQWEAIGQLALAGVLGGLVGMEREYRGRPAGFRTHALVALGCCLVMLVSLQFGRLYPMPTYTQESVLRIDPARVAYGVMAGMGFLGAGAIIRSGMGIRGLTTAASLWCMAAVGLAVGVGLYLISVAATALVLFTLFVLNRLEGLMHRRWYKHVRVVCEDKPGQLDRFIHLLEQHDIAVVDVGFERDMEDRRITMTLSARLPDRKMLPRVYEFLDGQEGVYTVEVL